MMFKAQLSFVPQMQTYKMQACRGFSTLKDADYIKEMKSMQDWEDAVSTE